MCSHAQITGDTVVWGRYPRILGICLGVALAFMTACRPADTSCATTDFTCPGGWLLITRSYHYLAYAGDASGVFSYSVDLQTGALTSAGSYTLINCSKGLISHNSLHVLYCLGTSGTDKIQVISTSDKGALTLVQTVTLGDATYAGLFLRPQGDFLAVGHGSNGELAFFRVAGDGSLTTAFSTGASTGGAATAFSRYGTYVYSRLSGGNVYGYSFGESGLTPLANFAPADNTWVMVESKDSNFVYASTNASSVFILDTRNGFASNFTAASKTTGMPYLTTIINDFSPDGRFAAYNSGTLDAGTLSYNASNGTLTQASNVNGVLYGSSRFSPDGRFIYSATATQYDVYTVDSNGGMTRNSGSPVTTAFTAQSPYAFVTFRDK